MRRALPVLGAPTVDATICGPCGGKCCNHYPGIAIPEDFGAPDREVMRERISAALRTGRWAVDYWEGDPRPADERGDDYWSSHEFLRPAMKGHEGQAMHAGWAGPCTFSGPAGCELEHDARPRNCRGLIPTRGPLTCSEKRDDGSMVTKQDFILTWTPYVGLLAELADEARRAA